MHFVTGLCHEHRKKKVVEAPSSTDRPVFMKLIALAAAVGAALMLPASAAPKKGPRTNAVGVTRWPAPLRGVGCHAMGAYAPLARVALAAF